MSQKTPGIPAWKKVLIAVLILADCALAVVGAVTIPTNFRRIKPALAPIESSLSALPEADESHSTTGSADYEQQIPSVKPEQKPDSPAEVSDFSAKERPSLEDFLWYTEGVFYDGAPQEKTPVEQFEFITGRWKALIIYDPDNSYDSNATEYLNIDISGTVDGVKLMMDWYLIFWSGVGESYDESDMEDTAFTGKWENCGLWASGPGTVRLTEFYEINGKQYAIGTMDTPDGIPAYVALVRP